MYLQSNWNLIIYALFQKPKSKINHCLSKSCITSSSSREWTLVDDLSPVRILLNEFNRKLEPLTFSEDWVAPADVPSMLDNPENIWGGAVGAVPPVGPAGASRGSGRTSGWASVRQIGHVECEPNHLSTHSAWKTCLQFGSNLAISSFSIMLRHTAHSVVDVGVASSSPLKTNTGNDAMTAGSSPLLGCSPERAWATVNPSWSRAARRRAWRRRTHLAYKCKAITTTTTTDNDMIAVSMILLFKSYSFRRLKYQSLSSFPWRSWSKLGEEDMVALCCRAGEGGGDKRRI
jgi:hypothetical protein